jgi:hypothetical protein
LHDEGRVGAQALEFWTTLSEKEFDKIRNGHHSAGYISNFKSDLITLLLQCISKVQIESEDEEDDEWGVTVSAGCCL